jgi:exosortase/archaeosortase family protein
MATSPEHTNSLRRSSPDPIKALWRAWVARKAPVFKVAAKFAAVLLLYYGFSLVPFFDRALKGWVISVAQLASYLLNHLMGEQSQIIGSTISSGQFAITVLTACSCVDFVWFYCAALIAFPSRWLRKIPGILAGVAAILALNLARIMSLYLVGVHFPSAFDAVHEDVWSVLLITATVGITATWIGWAGQDKVTLPDAT